MTRLSIDNLDCAVFNNSWLSNLLSNDTRASKRLKDINHQLQTLHNYLHQIQKDQKRKSGEQIIGRECVYIRMDEKESDYNYDCNASFWK